MASILPFIFYLLLARVFELKCQRSYGLSLLAAAVLMGAGTILATDVLSFFKLLTYPVLTAGWLIADAGILAEFLRLKGFVFSPLASRRFYGKSWTVMAGLLFLLVLLPVTLTAIQAAPGNWDSMMYHLARVEHWVQDRSLVFYPTNIDRQLWKDDGGEIFILHLRILAGSDRLCNLVQMLAWWGCMLSAWAILELWRRNHWEKLLAVVFVATIPMSILQASSTQGDSIGSFWLMVFVYFTLEALKNHQRLNILLAGLSLGLALLTRETNYLYAWPFVCWLGISLCCKGWKHVFIALGLIAACVLLINAGHYSRNLMFYHKLLSPGNEDLVNDHINLATLLINAVRNTVMHITTPLLAFNDHILGIVEHCTRMIGIDIQDRSSMVTDRFIINSLFLDEDYAQNPLHLLLMLVLLMYTPLRWATIRKRKNPQGEIYVLALAAAMATFCLILKWQPFNSRLHMSIFMLAAVPMAMMAGRLHSRVFMCILMLIFIIPSLLWVFRNDNRPLIGPSSIWKTSRYEQYYRKRPTVFVHDKTAATILGHVNCSQVGLIIRGESWEYPFWVIMRQQTGSKLRIEQVDTGNDTVKLSFPLGNFAPCGLYMEPSDGRRMVVIGDHAYGRVYETRLPDGSNSAVYLGIN